MTTNVLSLIPDAYSPPPAHPLDVFFGPESIAVVGATDAPDSVGRTVMANLIRSPFGGVLYPVSRRRPSVLGIRTYPSLDALPGAADLAVVVTPAPAVPGVLAECAAAGVKGAIVMASGCGDGANLGEEVRAVVRESGMRVLGANSLGVACPRTRLNATFAPAMVPAGKVGFLSQSGALLTALLSQEHSHRVGCSAFVSVGSLLDVGWAEWIEYLGADEQTECLAIYLERLDDARSFFAAVREVAPHKPVILIRGGEGAGHDPAEEEVFKEACRCSGVLLVRKVTDLFRAAALLTEGVTARGQRLAIVSNARGPALLAAAALRADQAQLAPLTGETLAALGEVLPGRLDGRHPVDVGDDADGARLVAAAGAVGRDPNADALLVLLAPAATIDPVRAAEGLCGVARRTPKPVLACWLWGASPESLAVLRDGGVPTFHSPEAAVRTFGHLWRHTESLLRLAEINAAAADAEEFAVAPGVAADILTAAGRLGRSELTDAEARALLACFGLTVQRTRTAADELSAVEAADAVGCPVLVELVLEGPGEDGGELVRLKAESAEEVCRVVRAVQLLARERFGGDGAVRMAVRPFVPPGAVRLAVGCRCDGELGPVIRLGEGGPPGEPPRRAARALAPLSPLTARELIVHGAGGALAESGGLEWFLLQLSRLAVEQPGVEEITFNPVFVWDGHVIAGDVRVSLR